MRLIDADALADKLEQIISDYISHGMYLSDFDIRYAIDMVEDMPTLTPPNEWVRVEERLPENGQIVLFHQKDGFIYCAEYFVGKELMSPEWLIDNDSWNAKVVTHWMPLPAPPEKENSHE